MIFLRRLFPCALAACSIAGISITALAQSGEARLRQVAPATDFYEVSCSPDDPAIVSEAAAEDIIAARPVPVAKVPITDAFHQLMTAAIDERLGSHYRWGGTGPNGFDCSGFVWSIFQSAGITFERGSATNAKTFRLAFQRCPRALRAPRFTG